MNYIIFDLEFNQMYTKKSTYTNTDILEKKHNDQKYSHENDKTSEMPFEIIQIGALKLNENFETIGTFNSFVKPTLYKEIHPFIQELTSITTEMVCNENPFPDIYEDFITFIGNDDFTMVVWGADDIKQLIKNIRFHKLSLHNNIKKYIDIQNIASKKFNTPNGNRLGLKSAVRLLNIPCENEFHNALNDAIYTAHVFRNVFNKNIKPTIYSDTNHKKDLSASLKVDTEKLISQFEKIFNRKMTKEEKCIIRIAYNMGKTHQFLK